MRSGKGALTGRIPSGNFSNSSENMVELINENVNCKYEGRVDTAELVNQCFFNGGNIYQVLIVALIN